MTFDDLLELEAEKPVDAVLSAVSDALDKNDHEDDEERRILALYEYLGGDVDLSDISECRCSCYGMTTFEAGNAEYAVATDDEADEAWDSALDNYLEDCIYPELPDSFANYFDDEKWKRDARFDGRGHALSGYDGTEDDAREFCIFRSN